MARKKKKSIVTIPTSKQVHLSPNQCELLYVMLNNVQPKEAGGIRYVMILSDIIKSLGSERKEDLIDDRQDFVRRFTRVRAGDDGLVERRAIKKELEDWLEEQKLTNEVFPSDEDTIAVTIPPESSTVLLNVLIHHSRIQTGPGLVAIMELCDKFEFRSEFLAQAAIVDADDEKKEQEARDAAKK